MRFAELHAPFYWAHAMTWGIRPQLHLCQIGDAFVGLDLAEDRYLLYRGETVQRLERFQKKQASRNDIAALVEQRIVEQGRVGESPFNARVPAPRSSIVHRHNQSLSLVLAVQAAVAQVQARRVIARNPLIRIFENLRQATRAAQTPSLSDCLSVVTAFRNARRYFSQRDQCLACSIAMSEMMARRGARTQLVIGVALPFVAHCWIQVGETVLSDTVDRVRSYAPILVV